MLKIRHASISLISLLVGLFLWQYFLSIGSVPSLMPTPLEIASSFIALAQSGELSAHIWASLGRLLPGWLMGICAGWLTGLIIGLSSLAFRVAIPWLVLLFPVPKIALLPVFILVFGIGETAKIVTVFVAVFFPAVFCIWQSVRSVPVSFIEMGKSFGLSRYHIVWSIVIPGSLPGVLLACRLTTPLALIILLAAEMLGADRGVGALIMGAGSMAQLDQLFAGVTVLSLFGLVMFGLWGWLEKKWLHWQKQ